MKIDYAPSRKTDKDVTRLADAIVVLAYIIYAIIYFI
jgi:hypothetical protein